MELGNKRDIEVVVKDFISIVERGIDYCSKNFGLKVLESVYVGRLIPITQFHMYISV